MFTLLKIHVGYSWYVNLGRLQEKWIYRLLFSKGSFVFGGSRTSLDIGSIRYSKSRMELITNVCHVPHGVRVILNLFCTMLLFSNTGIQASFMVDQTVKMCQTNTSAKVIPPFSNRELILMGPELCGISWSSRFNNLVWINDSGAKVILCLPLMLIDPNSFFSSHTGTLCVGLTGVRSQLKSP